MDGCIVRFLYATGCRISEALGVRLTDCHVNGGVTVEVTGKGGKARKVRLARALFDEMRQTFNGSTWLFESGKGKRARAFLRLGADRKGKQAGARQDGVSSRAAALLRHGHDSQDGKSAGGQ